MIWRLAVVALCLLLAASPAWGALAVPHTAPISNGASTNAVSTTFSGATSDGDALIVCAVIVDNAGGCCGTLTVDDNASGGSNTYSYFNYVAASGSGRMQVFYTPAAKSITQATAHSNGTSAYFSIACLEVTGAATASPVDVDPPQQQESYSSSATTGDTTTVTANTVVVGVAATGPAACALSTKDAGWTDVGAQSGTASQNGLVLAYQILASTQTIAYRANNTNACGAAMSIPAFKIAAPPSTGCRRRLGLLGVGC